MASATSVSSPPLFDAKLISPEVQASLPDNYQIRPLRRTDYHAGFLDVSYIL
jgi:glucosamine-phosphate N-acetyltransferase